MSAIRFRVGLVGAGHISQYHLQALRRIADVSVVGVFDLNPQCAAACTAASPTARASSSYTELLKAVDVVHVLTPPESHAALTLQALEAGCDVFVEKPLAATESECHEIQERAEQRGRTVGVDHSLLLDPFTRQAQKLIARGAIGRVLAVECLRSQDYPEYEGGPYPAYVREGGAPFRDLGIHAFYQIEAFLGPIQQMQWQLDKLGDNPLMGVDEWRVMMRCERGTAQLQLSWNARPLQDLILIQGTHGLIRLDRFGMNVTVKRDSRLPEHPQRAFNALWESAQTAVQIPLNLARVATGRIRRYHGLQAMVEQFYESLRTGREPIASPAAARRIAHWLDQVAGEGDHQQLQRQQRGRAPLTADTLVTGATGFIGGHLLRRLLSEGRRVRILCRRCPAPELTDHPLVEIVRGDLGHPPTVERAVQGVDVVYHVGGTVHGTRTEFWRGSVVGTRNVVESCLSHKVKQLVYVSSLSVLQALGQEGKPADETAPLEPFPERRGLYTQTKLAAEQIVLHAAREQALPVVIVRPGEVIGSGAPVLSSGVGQRRGPYLVLFGDGDLPVPLIHVDDLIDALRLCETHAIRDGSLFHLVDPQVVTQNELAQQYRRLTGDPLKLIHIPKIAVFALALAAQTAFLPLRRPAPISLYRMKSALTHRQFDSSRARRLLGWRPTRGVLQGLREAVQGTPGDVEYLRAAEVERVS